MTTRDELRAKIADIRELLADAKACGDEYLVSLREIDLEVAKDDLQLFIEEQADFDYLPQTGNPIQDYLNEKRRV